MGYLTKSILKNETAQSVAQSQTEQVISTTPSSLSAEDSKYFLYLVKCSALVVGTAISFKLQHSAGDGVWYNVGSSANATAVQKTCTDSDTDATDNDFTVTSHGFATGDRILLSTAGTLPTGLTAGEYWVIKVDTNTIKLAATKALALAGTAVDISDTGSGTFRFGQADYVVRMLVTDSTDVAQLPLWPTVRMVVDTGANDSVTISALRRTSREQV